LRSSGVCGLDWDIHGKTRCIVFLASAYWFLKKFSNRSLGLMGEVVAENWIFG
jgi:hypothetical protein